MDTMTDISVGNITLLSINRASKEMKIGKKRIIEMIQNGEIRVIKYKNGTVKIPKSELIRWVQDRQQYNVILRLPDYGQKIRKTPAFDAQLVMKKILNVRGKR